MVVVEAFAGLGGQALGWHRAGAEHAAFIERDPFCRSLLARHWPGVPIHDDVTTFDAASLRGRVDALTGGIPCQPVSAAGLGRGTADDRWLWGAFVDVAVALDVPMVVAENVRGLLTAQRGAAMLAVLCAFEAAGMAVEWDMLAAGTLGAPHRRERVFLVARRDGLTTWPRAGEQQSMFRTAPPAKWPAAGRWSRGVLTARDRQWPTPSPLPWEVAGGVDALPTPCAGAHNDGEDIGQWDARRAVLAERHGDNGAGEPLSIAARRSALPTPAARDSRDPNSAASQDRRNADSARGQQLPNELRDRGIYPEGGSGRLNPRLPEWMLGLPDGWSLPDGPSLVDAPSRPYLPDLTAELALTTEREHRRPRLRALGNACQVEVAQTIAAIVRAQTGAP